MYEGCLEFIEIFILLFFWEKREIVEILMKKNLGYCLLMWIFFS